MPDRVWAGADAVLANRRRCASRPLLDKIDTCRIVVRSGVGFDLIDVAAFAARGIAVCNVPDYGTGDVADHAMAMMLALRRGLPTFTDLLTPIRSPAGAGTRRR